MKRWFAILVLILSCLGCSTLSPIETNNNTTYYGHYIRDNDLDLTWQAEMSGSSGIVTGTIKNAGLIIFRIWS